MRAVVVRAGTHAPGVVVGAHPAHTRTHYYPFSPSLTLTPPSRPAAEIAVHTVNHLQMYQGFKDGDGSIEKEIMDDKNWLATECGIPAE